MISKLPAELWVGPKWQKNSIASKRANNAKLTPLIALPCPEIKRFGASIAARTQDLTNSSTSHRSEKA